MHDTTEHDSPRLSAPEPADPHWLVLGTYQAYMRQVQRDEPDWYQRYDDSDMLKASEALLLAKTAPSEFTAGLLVGRWLLLRELATLTERTTD